MPWGSEHEREPLSAEYRRNRPLVLRRDNWTCQLNLRGVCKTSAAEVDHIINRAQGGDDSMGNLRAVCVACHKKKTHMESRVSYRKRKAAAKHSWTRLPAPGLITDFSRHLGRLVVRVRGRSGLYCLPSWGDGLRGLRMLPA